MDLGGFLPQRRRKADPLPVPALETFAALLKATAKAANCPPRWPSCAS
jgi:pyruvate dehydrogenase E1 component